MCCLSTRHRRSAPHTELQWYTCISALGYPQPSALFRATLCKSHVIYFEPRRIRVRAGLVRYLIAPTDYCTGGRDPALTRCGREIFLVEALDSTANPRRCVSTASRRRYAYSTWPNVSVRTFLRPYHVQGGGKGRRAILEDVAVRSRSDKGGLVVACTSLRTTATNAPVQPQGNCCGIYPHIISVRRKQN